MVSGIGAAIGPYKAVLLGMVLAIAGGLLAGLVQPLFVGDDPLLWVERPLVLWVVLVAVFWRTADPGSDKASMSFCMLTLSVVICAVTFAWITYC